MKGFGNRGTYGSCEVDFSDIEAFIGILVSSCYLGKADCNKDGVVTFADISVFIAILIGGYATGLLMWRIWVSQFTLSSASDGAFDEQVGASVAAAPTSHPQLHSGWAALAKNLPKQCICLASTRGFKNSRIFCHVERSLNHL